MFHSSNIWQVVRSYFVSTKSLKKYLKCSWNCVTYSKKKKLKNKKMILYMYFLKISVPNWFHTFCWTSCQALIKQNQSTRKQIMEESGRKKTGKCKNCSIGSIWTSYVLVFLFIHWQINLHEWKCFKGVTFHFYIWRAKLTFSIYWPSLITVGKC